MTPPRSARRRGTITPLVLVALVVMMAAFAVAIDYAYLSETRVEMQTSSDSAGLAAADLFADDAMLLNDPASVQALIAFRPVTTAPLPLAPLAILSDPTGVNPQSWEFNVGLRNGLDLFRFDRTTRTLVADPAGDGLHEITVQLAPPGGPFNTANAAV